MDIVIIRENEEDLYAGIEHQQTDEVVQCLKLISRPGCEKIVRYAFEYAKQQKRKKVTCFTKDNIMKQTDGLFHQVFDEIAREYPEIENEHWIIDIGAANRNAESLRRCIKRRSRPDHGIRRARRVRQHWRRMRDV
jgi:isocitrate dehydrogenase